MKLTKQRLREIIKEELSRVLKEEPQLKRWKFLDVEKQERTHEDATKYIWALYQLKKKHKLSDEGVRRRFKLQSPEEGLPWTDIPGHEPAPFTVQTVYHTRD